MGLSLLRPLREAPRSKPESVVRMSLDVSADGVGCICIEPWGARHE